MQDTTARGLDKGATRLQKQGNCKGVSLTLIRLWLLLADLLIFCSQDCGLAVPSMSGSADPVEITRLLMCFEHTLQELQISATNREAAGPRHNILHAFHLGA